MRTRLKRAGSHTPQKYAYFTNVSHVISHTTTYRVLEKRDLVSPETLIIHVGTNDLKTTINLDFVMGEVYALVSTAKKKLPNCRLVLSGVLRH